MVQEVEETYARPESDSLAPAALNSLQERQREESLRPQTSHYASIRARLADAVKEGAECSSREEPDDNGEPAGILSSDTKFQELADVMYFWALAEAYLQHPQMQQDMRQAFLQSQCMQNEFP